MTPAELDHRLMRFRDHCIRAGAIRPCPNMTQQENIARWYEHFGRKIREMKWTTYEQYCNDPNKICPKCGSDKLDLD